MTGPFVSRQEVRDKLDEQLSIASRTEETWGSTPEAAAEADRVMAL